jgi:hypothetical protein
MIATIDQLNPHRHFRREDVSANERTQFGTTAR